MKIRSLDHLVLTVRNVDEAIGFYSRVLGMAVEEFFPADGTRRLSLKYGSQKINLHIAGAEFEPKATVATPGSADLCFLSEHDVTDWINHLENSGITVVEGPVPRTGATGPINSIYVRDPDGNLIEISNQA